MRACLCCAASRRSSGWPRALRRASGTGWNLFNRSFYEDGFCTLQGSFIPFAGTRAERIATGDPRLAIEERYPSKETYVAAIRKAANGLVANRYLLAEDAARLLAQAAREGIKPAPYA